MKQLSSPLSIALNHKINYSAISENELRGTGIDKYSEDDKVIGPENPMLALISNNGQPTCDQRWLNPTL